jgi:4-amino-4-deoxy-L-arabinose transferase-like glycosyltransferase
MAFRENGFNFLLVFFINHNLARYVSDIHHHTQPFYYYAPVVLGLVFPWSGWLLFSMPARPLDVLRRWPDWDRRELFLGCWILFPLLFFSLSSSKLPGYVLPMLAPLALWIGVRLSERSGEVSSPARAAAWTHLALSIVVGMSVTLLMTRQYGAGAVPGILIAASLLIPAAAAFSAALRGKWRRAAAATVIQGFAFTVAITLIAFPYLGRAHSTRDIALEALRLRSPGEPIVTYRFFHHTLGYYTGYQVAADLRDVESVGRFAEAKPRMLAVTEKKRLPELEGLACCTAEPLIAHGKLQLVRLAFRPRPAPVRVR